jgi:hypothetical protein
LPCSGSGPGRQFEFGSVTLFKVQAVIYRSVVFEMSQSRKRGVVTQIAFNQ